jgi:23S rRNA (adenine2030-N6)-methyltransferase
MNYRHGFHAGNFADVVKHVALVAILLVRGVGADRYPGSPLIVSRLLRSQDRLTAVEKRDDEAAALEEVLARFRTARAVRGDGYGLLPRLIPPREKRGLVLIDPPYESEDEFRDAARALVGAHRRFATGLYLLWFPAKSANDADLLCGELLAGGIRKMVRVDIDVSPGARDAGLTAAGLVVVNPPFGFVDEMRACLRVLDPLLARDPARAARSEVQVLAGE